MSPRATALAMTLAALVVTTGCATAPCECAVDEERIARRVAELVAEREAELAEEGDDGDGTDDSEPDGESPPPAGGGAGRGPAGRTGPVPAPASAPVAAAAFSDPAPAAPSPGVVTPRPAPRPAAGEPAPRVWVPLGRSPSRGPAGALVTLVAFTDFQCPFCSRAAETIEELRGRYPDELRVVFKHFPLEMHRRAMPAAEAAVEAFVQGGQDAFWRMHDTLFAHNRALEPDDLVRYASELGLDAGRLDAAVQGDVHRAAVAADIALGRASGVNSTPTFFLNGTRLSGALPIDAFVAAVESELAVARAQLARGTPRTRIYETIANGAERRPRGTR